MTRCEGCTWNNELAKKVFQDQVKEHHSVEYAKSYLRENIRHWIAKRDGREIPSWIMTLNDDDELTVGDRTLINLTEAPVKDKNSDKVSDAIKSVVPIEVETVRQVEQLARQGAEIIYMPEHSPTGIRFMTILRKDTNNPRKYICTQQDLGKDFSFDQAKARMQSLLFGKSIAFDQNQQRKEAFVFSLKRSTGGTSKEIKPTTSAVDYSPFFRREIDNQRSKVDKFRPDHLMAHQPRKEERSLVELIQRTHKEIQQKVKTLQFVAETKVAVGAVPVFLASLSKELPKPIRAVEKSIARHKRKERKRFITVERGRAKKIRVVKKEGAENRVLYLVKRRETVTLPIKRVDSIHPALKPEMKIVLPLEKEIKPKKKKESLMPQRLDRKRTREVGLLRRKEKKQKRQRKLLERALLRLVRKINNLEQRPRLIHQPILVKQIEHGFHLEKPRLTDMAPREIRRLEKKLRREKKKEAVLNFSFALAIWLLLHPPEVHTSPQSSKQEKRYHVSIYRYMITERADVKEPTPWVLSAIIWYLAMLREQGMRNAPINKYTNTTNKQMKTKIQSQGVIFVFAS